MKLRLAALTAACALLGSGAAFLLPGSAPDAEALTAADLVGIWTLRLGGDGWQRDDGGVLQSRIRGKAYLVVEHADPDRNTGRVNLLITLDADAQASLLGAAVPDPAMAPAFKATAAVIGNSISAISTGQADYVNALNLRFDADGKRAGGAWFLAFPAADATDSATFATGLVVTVRGKRVRTGKPIDLPIPNLPVTGTLGSR